MIRKIEIKGFGSIKVHRDMTHRSRCYLKLCHEDRFNQIQFDSLEIDRLDYQKGYDYNGEEIYIKILK